MKSVYMNKFSGIKNIPAVRASIQMVLFLLLASGYSGDAERVYTYGNPYVKNVRVKEGRVQALWMGVDIPEEIPPGTYKGKILIGPHKSEKQEVTVALRIKSGVLADRGAAESDGYLRYRFQLKAMEDINMKDIRLEIPFRNEIAEYMMGMGLPGTAMPRQHRSR
jgi:hypothetical protein